MMPQMWVQIQPHDLRIARSGFGAPVGHNDRVQPTIKILCNGLLRWCNVHRCGLIAMERLELVGHLLAGLAIHDFATALTVHESQIDRCAPRAVALALVNATLAVATSLCHGLPPYASFVTNASASTTSALFFTGRTRPGDPPRS
jgi:hypothetical protein